VIPSFCTAIKDRYQLYVKIKLSASALYNQARLYMSATAAADAAPTMIINVQCLGQLKQHAEVLDVSRHQQADGSMAICSTAQACSSNHHQQQLQQQAAAKQSSALALSSSRAHGGS
jgi:hypothetical protein